jgi:hypothetical protein
MIVIVVIKGSLSRLARFQSYRGSETEALLDGTLRALRFED